jgi:hypothetical protein
MNWSPPVSSSHLRPSGSGPLSQAISACAPQPPCVALAEDLKLRLVRVIDACAAGDHIRACQRHVYLDK